MLLLLLFASGFPNVSAALFTKDDDFSDFADVFSKSANFSVRSLSQLCLIKMFTHPRLIHAKISTSSCAVHGLNLQANFLILMFLCLNWQSKEQ